MRSLRRTSGVLAVLVLLAGVAGCGNGSGDDDDKATDRSHEAQPENPDGAPCQYLPAGEAAKKADPPAETAAYTGTVDVDVETNRGDTEDPYAASDIVAKFHELADPVWGVAHAARVADAVMALDAAPNLAALHALLAGESL